MFKGSIKKTKVWKKSIGDVGGGAKANIHTFCIFFIMEMCLKISEKNVGKWHKNSAIKKMFHTFRKNRGAREKYGTIPYIFLILPLIKHKK